MQKIGVSTMKKVISEHGFDLWSMLKTDSGSEVDVMLHRRRMETALKPISPA
jgi:hypothetical protein